MQTVRAGDTVPVHWIVADEATKQPVDITGATIEVTMQLTTGGAITTVPGIPTEPTLGKFMHEYDMLAPGTYNLTALVDGVPGEQTAPTKQNQVLRVVARIGV